MSVKEKIIQVIERPAYVAGFLVVITLLLTGQRFLLGDGKTYNGDREYTHYNNYVIFTQSFHHLVNGDGLYELYPEEHWDLFKYSPTFAVLIAPLAVLPDFIGLSIWNLLNVLILFAAIWLLPLPTARSRLFILGFILIELITSVQNTQCNPLIAGMFILAFISMEKDRSWLAALLISLMVFIKLFGFAAFILFIFYPGKLKSAAWSVFWLAVLAALPLLFISPDQLIAQYQDWLALLQFDHGGSTGLSVMGWLQTWFNIHLPKLAILAAGAALLLLPLLHFRAYSHMKFRLDFLCSILIWVVIFNHKAESATFIIAVTGVAVWYFSGSQNRFNYLLVILVFLLTVLSPTYLFPQFIRDHAVIPYVLKAVPVIFVWFRITYDLLMYPAGLHEAKPVNHLNG